MADVDVKRDVWQETATEKEKTWYILKYGSLPKLTVHKRAVFDKDRAPGERHYLEYIITDKDYEDINWEIIK